MIAQNICHAAVLAGHSVLFRPLRRCLRNCIAKRPKAACASSRAYAKRNASLHRRSRYLSFDDKSADLLYEVINRRYEQNRLILTTNL